MKAISAKPQSISEVFTGNSFNIPGYQRRYEWEKDQCEQMWGDFVDFNQSKKDGDKYFLGAIVVEKTKKEKTFNIIDGQQRVTTITLLLAAIFSKANTHKRLEKILKKVDPISDEAIQELRLKSQVIGEDYDSLNGVVLGQRDNISSKNRFLLNFNFFSLKVDEWIRENGSPKLNELIENILEHILLLPIECESTDDALVLFNTLNGRGLQLSDADIFKAQIYATIENESDKEEFIERWNNVVLTDSEVDVMTDFFRIHMHVLRAEKGILSKEKALRSFYNESDGDGFLAYPSTINAIEQYSSFADWPATSKVNIAYSILSNHNNHYWKYPIYTYIANKSKAKDQVDISAGDLNNFEILADELIKYMLIKGVVRNSVNVVKDLIFKVCKDIADNKFSLAIKKIKADYKDDVPEFFEILERPLEKRYVRTIVMTAAYLDAKENVDDLNSLSNFLLTSKCDVEHILPKKWNNYDGWDYEAHKECINQIGNLVLLNREINISASNEFFARKKDQYRKSEISAALILAKHKSYNWKPVDLKKRSKNVIELFEKFI